MLQCCPECGVKLSIRRILTGTEVTSGKCHHTFTVAPTVALAKPSAKIRPTETHSIYAWFVGLPCGILMLAVTLAILVPLGYFVYYEHRTRKLAESLAAEAENERQYQRDLEERRLREPAEAKRREQEARHRLDLEEAANRAKREKRQQEIERERLEAQGRIAAKQAELEKQRLDQQAKEKARERELAEAQRLKKEQERMIERDHEEILAYMRQNLPVTKNLKSRLWHEPIRGCLVVDPSQEGRLYRLQGRVTRVGGDSKMITVTLNYYFLVNNLTVVAWEKPEDSGTLKKLKVLEGAAPGLIAIGER